MTRSFRIVFALFRLHSHFFTLSFQKKISESCNVVPLFWASMKKSNITTTITTKNNNNGGKKKSMSKLTIEMVGYHARILLLISSIIDFVKRFDFTLTKSFCIQLDLSGRSDDTSFHLCVCTSFFRLHLNATYASSISSIHHIPYIESVCLSSDFAFYVT